MRLAGNPNYRPKELSDELDSTLGVKPGRFRQLFNQTLQQYLSVYLSGEGAWPNDQFSSRSVEDDRGVRAQRAARFSSHLQKEKSAPAGRP